MGFVIQQHVLVSDPSPVQAIGMHTTLAPKGIMNSNHKQLELFHHA